MSHRERAVVDLVVDVVPPGRLLVHRFTKVVAFATFVLLVIGGIVNPTGSSLACPEPTILCNDQIFPEMVGGVLYEHGHRLAAMTVGILQIILTILLFRKSEKKLGLLLLAMVIGQGLLGAITVKYKLPWYVSTAHLLLAMSYFATLIYTAFRTRPQPSVVEIQQHVKRRAELGTSRSWIVAACVAVFVQLLLGALVRHHGAALVCLGMPTCTLDGGFWPDVAVQQLHMVHRGFGVITGIITTIAAIQILRTAKSWSNLRLLASIAPLLVTGQIVLGIYTVLTVRAVPLAVGHFAGAASLWALWMSAFLMTRDRTVKSVAERESHPLPRTAVRVA